MESLIELLFPNRLHRLAYFVRGVATDILAGCIYAFGGTNSSSTWLVLCYLGLGAYQLLFIILPRIRDIGMRSRWLLLVFVPGVNVVFGVILLFREPAILSNQGDPAPQGAAIEAESTGW